MPTQRIDPWQTYFNYRIRDFLHRIANGDFGDDVQAIRRSGENPDVGSIMMISMVAVLKRSSSKDLTQITRFVSEKSN